MEYPYANPEKGTYRLTVQEIVDDLGVWHTDWGAEELGGFIRPFQEEATGNLYGRQIINRTGTRDTDGFLLYLGYDGAPLDGEYVLTVTGLDAPHLMAETYYDDPIGDHLADDYVPAMKAYADHFGLDDDFIEFPEDRRGRRIQHRPAGTRLGESEPGDAHLVFDPGAEDVGAYLLAVRSRERYSAGDYELFLRGGPSVSEPSGEDIDGNIPTRHTPGWVRVGEPVTGYIGDRGVDADDFAVLLRKGRTYRIEARGSETGDGTLDDPTIDWVGYHDGGERNPCHSSNSELCGNDDGGEGLNALLDITPTRTGVHYVSVGNSKAAIDFDLQGPDAEGSYTLSVTEVETQ